MAKVNEAAEKIAIKLIEDGYELNDMNFVCDQSSCECANAAEVPEVNLTVIVADKVDDEYAADVAAAADLPCVDSYCDRLALSGEGEEGVSKIALANEEDPLMPPSIATYIECKLGAEYFNILTEAEEKAEAKEAAKQRYKNKAGNEPTTVEKPRKTKEIADEADATAKSRISKLNYGDMDKYARSNTPSNPKVRTFRTNADYKKVEESNEIGLYKPVNESKVRGRNHRLWENVSEPYIDDVVETLKSDPKVIDAYYNEDDKHFVVRVEGNKDGSEAYSLIRSTMSKVDDILAANKCEIDGIGWIHNDDFDAWTKDFEANKPRPVDPSRDYSWKQRSYYDRTKGKGPKLLAKYHDEYDAWRKEYLDGLKDHPRSLSGFTFDVTWRGHAADVANFYKDTKYWGD